MMQVWKDVAGIELPESLLKFDSTDDDLETAETNGRLPHVKVDLDVEQGENAPVSTS